ncbi:hypothetical protein STEG23_011736, partial [Scotinomys teguina]
MQKLSCVVSESCSGPQNTLAVIYGHVQSGEKRIAYLGGVCSAKRKCVLAEDNGLNLAFTIAHELGH